MSREKRPSLKEGEFEAPITVVYNCVEEPKLSGNYVVALGAEVHLHGDLRVWRKALVNGVEVSAYAMVRNRTAYTDRKILRDGTALRVRAVEQHIQQHLIPNLEERRKREEVARYEAALLSADNWEVVHREPQRTISIQPLHLDLRYSSGPGGEKDRDRKRIILERIVELMKRYGMQD